MEVMVMEGAGGEMEISVSGCSSTTTATTSAADDEFGGRAWADFSPVVDWGVFGDDDDFQGLIESMMECDGGDYPDRRGCFALADLREGLAPYDSTPSNSGVSSGGSSGDVPMEALTEGGDGPNVVNEDEEEDEEVDEDEDEDEEEEEDGEREDMKGLRLVHLLMAAAEALTGENGGLDLARVILVRLKEMASPNAASNMERLAACFTDALQALLDASSSGGGGGSKHSASHHHQHQKQLQQLLHQQQHHPEPGDALAAFQLLQDMSPYVKFGHFTANQAILEAVAGERRVHILDYDIMEGVQWASLIQALVSRRDGPPPPHLRITAVSRGSGAGGNSCLGRRPIGTIQETGRRLAAFAASVGQPFSFGQCRLEAEESFRSAGLKLVKGEALVVNCMLHLPHSAATHRPALSVASFLSGAAALGPRLVTLVEEEAGGSAGPAGGFVDRFMDSLHHYSAVYDSLEAGFPMHGRARALVERVFLGPRIAGTVGRVYQTSECGGCGAGGGGGQEVESWSEWMEKTGFRKVGISFSNRCQAKLLVGLFNEGYRVEEAAANKLVLAWKSRRLLSASVWTVPPPPNPPPPSAMSSHCRLPSPPGAAAPL